MQRNRDYYSGPVSFNPQGDAAAMQGGIGLSQERAPSEIATELQLLDEALTRMMGTIEELGGRLGPVSLQNVTVGSASTPPAPTPVLCQTATTIYFSRCVVNDMVNKLRDQIDALRC